MYLTLTKEQDREVRQQVADMLVARHRRNWEPLEEDEWPLLDQPSGREALQFYRSRDGNWWMQIAATFPDRARWHARQYGALIKRYGPVNQMQVMAGV
jgi:hypothetical protein